MKRLRNSVEVGCCTVDEINGDVRIFTGCLECEEEKMNTTSWKVSKLASRYRRPAPVAVTSLRKGRASNQSVLLSLDRGDVFRDAMFICERSFWGGAGAHEQFRIVEASSGLFNRFEYYRNYSKDSKSSTSFPQGLTNAVRNLLLISLFTCACGGSILLWSYWRLRYTFENILGYSESRIQKKYLYPFDPGDVEFFIKKHCFLWLPPKLVTTPSSWRLSQEISRGGSNREIAIAKLSMLDNLTDSDCLHFALTLDLPTAFALAHNGADPRLFMSPPVCAGPSEGFKTYFGKTFRHVLGALPEDNIHPNLNHVYKSALRMYLPTEEEEQQYTFDLYTGFDEAPMMESTPPQISEARFVKVCLQATISHTRDPRQIKHLPKADFLELLVVIAERYKEDKEIMSLLIKVLANISCDPSYDEDIRSNGCLRILAEGAKDNDVRLILPAKRALHNLDREASDQVLLSGIYQLYPDFRVDESVLEFDVVFIHGILGGAFRTWRQQDKNAALENESVAPTASERKEWSGEKSFIASRFIFRTPIEHPDEAKRYKSRTELEDGTWLYSDEEIDLEKEHEESPPTQCWPRDWLPEDCPNARILAVDFDSFVTHWSGFCPVETTKRSLKDRASELLEKLHAAGVGKRPIIWITHSMGGLLAKSLLCQAAVSSKEYQGICQNTKGVVFCSVPHSGSYIALANTPRRYIFMPTEEALELTNSDNSLTLLHERFKRLWRAYKFKMLSFGEILETKSVFKVAFKMVPFSSADPEIGDFYPVKLNHLNTCKPHCRGSFVYRKIVDFIHRLSDQ